MLEDKEWIQLLEYLLEQLAEIGAVDVANEIREAISTRVIEYSEENLELAAPPSYYKEVGTRHTRLLTPKEAVEKALEVLKIRFEMLPSIAEQTAELLQRKPSEITWSTEDSSYFFLSNVKEFSESDLIMSENDRQVVNRMLGHLILRIEES